MTTTYTVASVTISKIAYVLERLLPDHPEGPYRLWENYGPGGTYICISKQSAGEVLVRQFGYGFYQAKNTIKRAEEWAKRIRYEPFPGLLDANSH